MRVAPSLACIAAGFLGACSSFGGDNNPFTVFADPAAVRVGTAQRAQDLKRLMDKAEQSTGGGIVNVIAYKTDYVSATEELKVLDATARSKNCPLTR